MNTGEETKIDVMETRSHSHKGKDYVIPPPPAAGSGRAKVVVKHTKGGTMKRGVAIFDFILRLCAVAAALAAAAAMGTTQQTLPFFTQFFQFQASYDDLPALSFFVVATAIVSAYLVLSLPFSIISIVRPHATAPRLLLIIFDTVMVALTTSAAASGAAIVYLAHNGNSNTNWQPICQQFGDFCQRISGAVVASFIAVALLIFLVILSAIALRKS